MAIYLGYFDRRLGPWDHGECRNGGHPDWVLTSCGKVRTTDPKYLACVEGWYSALAGELEGYYHKDGGPIVITQVDNGKTVVLSRFAFCPSR